MGKKKPNQQQQQSQDIYKRSTTAFEGTQTPSALENTMSGVAGGYQGAAETARNQNMADYGNIMGGYQDYMKNLNPTYKNVSYQRPAEMNEAYGYLRQAAPGYKEFSQTGGYSGQDIQELRARGVAPIRASYGNTMMELDRARALGGAGGAPNYIAAASRAQRELPGQMADAMTGVNAKLAEDIRSGRLQGLAGLAGIGSTMGGFAGDEGKAVLTADMANQGADIQTQGMKNQGMLAGLSGQTGLYGTTPAMASTFGNQALNAYGQQAGMEANRQQYGLGLLNAQIQATGQAPKPGTALWKKLAAAAAAGAATYFTAGAAAPAAAGIYAGIAGGGAAANSFLNA
jgi:hypothetical protein